MIVADTCVVIHLFNETALTNVAEELLKCDPYWILPSIWKEEYANVICKFARREKRPLKEVIEQYEFVLTEMKDRERNVDPVGSLKCALEYKISVYDAHFILLAKEYDIKLVTEDKEILKQCPDVAVNMQTFFNGI